LHNPYIHDHIAGYSNEDENEIIKQIISHPTLKNKSAIVTRLREQLSNDNLKELSTTLAKRASVRRGFHSSLQIAGLMIGIVPLVAVILLYANNVSPDDFVKGLFSVLQILLRLFVVTAILFALIFYIIGQLLAETRRHSGAKREDVFVLRMIAFGIASVVAVLLVAWIFDQQLNAYDVLLAIFQDLLADVVLIILYDMMIVELLQRRKKTALDYLGANP
jgi:hypothetical protein